MKVIIFSQMDIPCLFIVQRILDIVRSLDFDSDRRHAAGLSFPEAVDLMTKHTRKLHSMKSGDNRKKTTVTKDTVIHVKRSHYILP